MKTVRATLKGIKCGGTCGRTIGMFSGKHQTELFISCNTCNGVFCLLCAEKHNHIAESIKK